MLFIYSTILKRCISLMINNFTKSEPAKQNFTLIFAISYCTELKYCQDVISWRHSLSIVVKVHLYCTRDFLRLFPLSLNTSLTVRLIAFHTNIFRSRGRWVQRTTRFSIRRWSVTRKRVTSRPWCRNSLICSQTIPINISCSEVRRRTVCS